MYVVYLPIILFSGLAKPASEHAFDRWVSAKLPLLWNVDIKPFLWPQGATQWASPTGMRCVLHGGLTQGPAMKS
jgi:hypothetical protein